jgi:hypothetical protein
MDLSYFWFIKKNSKKKLLEFVILLLKNITNDISKTKFIYFDYHNLCSGTLISIFHKLLS